jgi:hypothetical protein
VNGRRRNLTWLWVFAIAVVILGTQLAERHWVPALVQVGIMVFLVLRLLQFRRRQATVPKEPPQTHPAPTATAPGENEPEPVEEPVATKADDDQWRSIWDDPGEGGSIWDDPEKKQ